MARITIRNLDDKVKTRLQIRTAGTGRLMEDEARLLILGDAVEHESEARDLASIIRPYRGPKSGVDPELPPRGASHEPPSFDWSRTRCDPA